MSLPISVDVKFEIDDHELSSKPVANLEEETGDPITPGDSRKRLLLCDLSVALFVRADLEGCELGSGEGALEDEDDTAGPSSQLGALGIDGASSSSSCV